MGTLDIVVSGLRSMKGNVLMCLTANPKTFPDCSKDGQAHKLIIPANKAGQIRMPNLIPGQYALAMIHDENANGKLDVRIMIPNEGFGFSRNPAVVFGPPKFKSAGFAMGAGEVRQAVKMKYML
jgi:uncharacterized protein (DUF2141 family)